MQMSEKEKSLLISEVNIIKTFQNPYIVKYYDRILQREEKKIYIVMELCKGGDLSHLIRRYRVSR